MTHRSMSGDSFARCTRLQRSCNKKRYAAKLGWQCAMESLPFSFHPLVLPPFQLCFKVVQLQRSTASSWQNEKVHSKRGTIQLAIRHTKLENRINKKRLEKSGQLHGSIYPYFLIKNLCTSFQFLRYINPKPLITLTITTPTVDDGL